MQKLSGQVWPIYNSKCQIGEKPTPAGEQQLADNLSLVNPETVHWQAYGTQDLSLSGITAH